MEDEILLPVSPLDEQEIPVTSDRSECLAEDKHSERVSPLAEPPRNETPTEGTLPDRRTPVIHSKLFRTFLKQYKRNIPKYDNTYAIPMVLDGFCSVMFVHNKPLTYKFDRYDTFLMENVDQCLENLNHKIRLHTDGYFRQVDETTVQAMRHPEFQSVLLAFFYLEGLWMAENVSKRSFFNSDGTIAENVQFIGFRHVRVIVQDGTLEARVHFEARHNHRVGGNVCFTMESDEEEGIYEHSLMEIPEVNLADRQVMDDDEKNLTVIHFRYMHNNEGFKAREAAPEKWKIQCQAEKLFVLDKPFRISIRYYFADVLRVEMDNLRGE